MRRSKRSASLASRKLKYQSPPLESKMLTTKGSRKVVEIGSRQHPCFRGLLVWLLLMTHAGIAYWSSSKISITVDEKVHLFGGLCYWHFNDYRMHPENGNLPQRVAAIPVMLFCQYRLPTLKQAAWTESDVWELGDQFLHQLGNDFRSLVQVGRMAMIILSCCLCFVIYIWSRLIFGVSGGLFSLFLATFSPTLLAHGSLMTSDTCFTLLLLTSTYIVSKLATNVTLHHILLGSLSVGALFVSKFSSVFILPISALILIVNLVFCQALWIKLPFFKEGVYVRRAVPKIAVYLLLTLAFSFTSLSVIWMSFGFRYSAFEPNSSTQAAFLKYGTIENAAKAAGAQALPFQILDKLQVTPEAWNYGGAYVAAEAQLRQAFLNGRYSLTGWRSYFPFTVLVKTPISLLIIVSWSLWLLYFKLAFNSTTQHERNAFLLSLVPLAAILLVMWPICISSRFNIGHRHILFTYPVLFIVAGALGQQMARRANRINYFALVMALHFLWQSISIFPNYLSYFNELVSARNGWKYLVDSNVDWGQNLPQLKQFLDARPTEKRFIYYFGSGSTSGYNIAHEKLPLAYGDSTVGELSPGIYLVSATFLQGLFQPISGGWTRDLEDRHRLLVSKIELLGNLDPSELQRRWDQGDPEIRTTIFNYNMSTSARLLAWLRNREPDHWVGYSILGYDLSYEDLNDALFGPIENVKVVDEADNFGLF